MENIESEEKVSFWKRKVDPKILNIIAAISTGIGLILLLARNVFNVSIPLYEVILPFFIFGVTFILFGLVSHCGSYFKKTSDEKSS